MAEDITYEAILAELLQDRANLDRMIEWVQGKLSHQNADRTVSVEHPQPETTGSAHYRVTSTRLTTDSFFRLSVPEAIKKYLNIVKQPRTAKEITIALDAGGLTHQAKNLYATVYPTLLRMEKASEVVRVGKGKWALSEWYPGGKKGANQEGKSESES